MDVVVLVVVVAMVVVEDGSLFFLFILTHFNAFYDIKSINFSHVTTSFKSFPSS